MVNAVSRIALTMSVAAAMVLAPTVAQAQSKKPAVVVSITNVDKMLADIGYLTRTAGTPEFGGLVTLMAGPYLQGLDTKRPAGMFLQFAGPQPTGVAFVPVTNLDQVLQQLENNNIEVEDAGDGLMKINAQRPLYLKEKGGWAFLSDSEENLATLPSDPGKQLAGLSSKYNVALQVNVRSIPEDLVDMAVSEMKNGFERNLENETDEEKRELQEKVGRQQLENFTRLLKESDQITVGWGVDSKAGKVFIDFGLTAVAGTKLATQMDAYKQIKSSFGGLELEDAAATLRFTAPVAKEDVAQARETLKALKDQAISSIEDDEDLKSDEAKEAAQQVVTALHDVLVATLESGKVDGGMAVVLEESALQIVAGGFIADGKVVQDQLKKLAKLAEEAGDDEAPIENLKFNAAKHKGVDLHTFSVPIPEDEEESQQLFGEELEVVIGTGKQSAYLSIGEGAMDLLKEVLDNPASGQELPPFQLVLSLIPIMEFAASMEEDPMLESLAETIAKSEGKDHIRITQQTIERGTTVRLEVEEGILKLIGAAAKAKNQQQQE